MSKCRNYDEFVNALTNVRNFKYRHCEAYWTDDYVYVVQDYGTVLLRQKPGKILYFDYELHSSTTSKIQNTIIKVFGIDRNKVKERKIYENIEK